MLTMAATDVRKNWSSVLDTVVREKPTFIKRTRDCVVLSNEDLMTDILSVYSFSAIEYIEDDGSITLSLNEIDLVENAENKELAVEALANSIREYAIDYYENFSYWSNASNRKGHIPYILKALLLDDIDKIGACISCQLGKN